MTDLWLNFVALTGRISWFIEVSASEVESRFSLREKIGFRGAKDDLTTTANNTRLPS